MRVLLIQAPLGRRQMPVYPLGLAYLAAALAPAHKVRILDAALHDERVIRETVLDFCPEAIGLGLRNIDTTQSHDPYFYFRHFPPFVRWLSMLVPQSPLIVGGSGFSLFPREVLEACPELGFGVEREGEKIFPALLSNLEQPEKVRGVYFRDGRELVYTGPAILPDFATLPSPMRQIDPRLYQEEIFQLGVQTKRGCRHRCIYCNYPQLNGSTLRPREPGAVVDEIEAMKRKYGIRRFAFADAIFNEPCEHARRICEELLARRLGLSWTAYFSVRTFTLEFMELAAAAGCELFEFSPDGLRQETLDGLAKEINEEKLAEVLGLFAGRRKPRFALQLMFNVPGARLRDFVRLCQVALLWPRRFPALDFVAITNMRIYPGTPLSKRALREGVTKTGQKLFEPVFYDPWPLRPLSMAIHLGGRVRRGVMKWRGTYRF